MAWRARAVEEVLARSGADQFDITMFGDEPYGNYNRILLSNILTGTADKSDIFLNALDWYEENGIRLQAGARVSEIDPYQPLHRTAELSRGATSPAPQDRRM